MKKRLILNTITSLLLQIVTLVCGFILPRLILEQYGSEVNGLVSSITQFLTLISFLELGVGAVIQSSLYKPLASNNNDDVSKIIVSGDHFFKKIALILLFYVLALALFFPFFSNSDFDWLYTSTLILAMSISFFAQYYFGIVDRLLLTADQRGYIQYVSQIITLIVNTVACVIEIKLGFSIQFVKLTTSIIYLLRPLVLRIYINKKYCINRKIKLEGEPLKQKRNGLAQHIAAIVLNDTDIIVLTLFSSLSNVSIYSVYFLIVNGIKNIFISSVSGVQSALGEMIAKNQEKKLFSFFSVLEWAIHTIVIFLFSCTALLIVPFIQIYTEGITDANYIQPIFAFLLVIAHGIHCLRIPYNIVILAAGHFKQTQANYIVAAIINIAISVVAVFLWGIIGVAIGTLIAMLYQTIWMAIYISKNIIKRPLRLFLKQIIVDVLTVGLIIASTFWIKLQDDTYLNWVLMALVVASISIIIIVIISFIFYRKQVKLLFNFFFKKGKEDTSLDRAEEKYKNIEEN